MPNKVCSSLPRPTGLSACCGKKRNRIGRKPESSALLLQAEPFFALFRLFLLDCSLENSDFVSYISLTEAFMDEANHSELLAPFFLLCSFRSSLLDSDFDVLASGA